MILLKTLLLLSLNLKLCWSRMEPPLTLRRPKPSSIAAGSISQDIVGKPLIVTPLIRSKQIAKARELSSVRPFVENVVSHAGYFTVEEKYNSNLFFWFFRKTSNDWKKAPVVLWLQGGPGCSSMYGLFEENGPFRVVKNRVKRRKYAWTNDYNVVYIDQPVGTGFSFTNSSKGYVEVLDKVADHLFEALTQFFQLYAELKDNEFYISGESYAGKYVPAIAYKIHQLKVAGRCTINLKGLFVVSAFSDPINMKYYAEFCHRIGIIDSRTANEILSMERTAHSLIRSQLWRNASTMLDEVGDIIIKASNIPSVLYDYSATDWRVVGDYPAYIRSTEIRKLIHVGNVSFEQCSSEVCDAMFDDIVRSAKPQIEALLEHYPTAFVGGQFDVIVAYPLVAQVLRTLRWSGAAEYRSARRRILYDKNRVVGYCKSAANLKDIFVRRASHYVPVDQPRVTLGILKKFINNNL